MSKIKFVTLFPKCTNVEILKDVGQIPYCLAKKYSNISSTIALYDVNFDDEYMNEYQKFVKVNKIKKVFNNDILSGTLYIIKNHKQIDWLNIYHPGRRTLYWSKLYKFLNPKGKVYVKMDYGFVSCNMYDENKQERNIFSKNTEIADLISVESDEVKKRLMPYSKKDIALICNGYTEISEKIDVAKERENIFITAARLGSPEKATDILIEAFAQSADKHNWKLKLIGGIEPEFNEFIENFLKKHPELKSRIEFTGLITDRKALYDAYRKAKVFVLPSLWESFGFVVAESLYCGCRVIVSDGVAPAIEFTNNLKYGQIVRSSEVDDLAQALYAETLNDFNVEQSQEISQYAKNNFSWENISQKIYSCLNK